MTTPSDAAPAPDSPLDDEQLAELEELLLKALEKLRRSMEVTDEAARPVELDQMAFGRLSRMDSLKNQAMNSNLQEREQARLSALLGALERMEEGRYGLCEECGDAIAYGRLLVVPEAATCTGCAG